MSLEKHYTAILEALGEDPSREGLADTPARAAKAMRHLCRGYDQNLEEIVNGALFTSDTREIVLDGASLVAAWAATNCVLISASCCSDTSWPPAAIRS